MPKSNMPVQDRTTLGQAAIYLAFGLAPLELRLQLIEGYPTILNDPFRQPPPDDTPLTEDDLRLRDAARRILSRLATGELEATGWPMFLTDCRDTGGDYPVWEIRYSDGSIRQEVFEFIDPFGKDETIPADFWTLDGVQWESSFVTSDIVQNDAILFRIVEAKSLAAYSDVTISIDELHDHGDSVSHEVTAEIPMRDPQINNVAPAYRSPFMDLMLRAEAHFGEHLRTAKKQEIMDWLNELGRTVDKNWSDRKSDVMATFLRHPDQQRGGNKRIS